jgi:hypothetical protein
LSFDAAFGQSDIRRVSAGRKAGTSRASDIPRDSSWPTTPTYIDTVGRLGENGGGHDASMGSTTMTLRTAVKTLLVLSLALPVISAVLVWVAGLLRAMGDAAGAAIVGHVGTVCQVVWTVSLVGLLLTLAITVLMERPPEGE